MGRRLDEIDRRILHALAADARGTSAPAIAEQVDVSPGTIRNRIEQLEDAGVIRGYHADIDYERSGDRLTNLFVCNAPIGKRRALASRALQVSGVINVRELRTGRGNLHVTAVGEDPGDLTRLAEQLNALGLEIEDEGLVQRERTIPYGPFGPPDGTDRSSMTDFVSLGGGAEVVDVTVAEGAPITDRTLSEANEAGLIDEDVLVIAIEREDEVLTPKGNTVVRAGDLVTVFSLGGTSEELLSAFEE